MSTILSEPAGTRLEMGQTPKADRDYRLWGLSISALHDRFWASHGIQVVRLGEPVDLVDAAELYMLTESDLLTVFHPRQPVESMYWAGASATMVRIHDETKRDYAERVVTDEKGAFVRVERVYGLKERRLARVAFTTSRDLAALWQRTSDPVQAWRDLRRRVPRLTRYAASIRGNVYDRHDREDEAKFVRRLLESWATPSVSVAGLEQRDEKLWMHKSAKVGTDVHTTGSVWVGAGRSIPDNGHVVGPAVLWDARNSSEAGVALDWNAIEPSQWIRGSGRVHQRTRRITKRLFDLCFAAVALTLTAPIYPIVMLAILIEDGRPFFFGHERETVGGRPFKCWKFRSMRKDAEKIKAQLAAKNQADGPQFFMENDPRLTKVGRLIRKLNIDELPQFFNVITGDMSIVGPRPSPYKENQYNPAWREARLSVTPGVTGLWQVRRTRKRGTDFQEWIRYDIEYVETANMLLDLKIIWETFRMMIGLGKGR